MNTIRRFIGLILLVTSLAVVAWGFFPSRNEKLADGFSPQQMQLPAQSTTNSDREGMQSAQSNDGINQAPAGIPENRSVNLEYPIQMREGDSDVILLTLEANDQGVEATAQFGNHDTNKTTIPIPNVYETFSVQAEALIDLPGMNPNPGEPLLMPVLPGQKTSFAWTIKPDTAGSYRGVVRMTIIFTPLGGGEAVRQPLYAKALEVDVVNLFGIGGQQARWMGLIGSVVGSFITVEDVVKWIFGGGKKNNRRKRR